MTNDAFELSRRKILAGLGTVGVASAGAGIGTTALFSDTESAENNALTAGELDLKVGWEEHYSDWSRDETGGVTTSMRPDEGFVGFPAAAPLSEQSVFVAEADIDRFLANTAIESFPDTTADDPGAADYDGRQAQFDDDSDICELPADLDGGGGVLTHPYRTGANVDGGVTIGETPNPQTTKAGDPLVDIADVKPGDFGEVTFSFHLCGNPGYVWLTGELVAASENGVTEPEADADGETSDTVELLEEIRAAVWYDTGLDGVYGADYGDKDDGEGDNYLQPGEQFITLGGALGDVLRALEDGGVPLDAKPVSAATTDSDEGSSVSEIPDGTTVYVSTDDDPFATATNGRPRNLNCADYATLLDLDIVGTAIEAAQLQAGRTYSSCAGLTVDDVDVDGGTVSLSTTTPVTVVSVKGGNNGENIYVFDEPVALDGVTFETPLNDNGKRPALSNIDVCCPVDSGSETPTRDRQCFQNSTTAYVGFEWWLPASVGNEVQTDSVEFDLGFYTEQCRHNDGSGQPSAASTDS